MKLDLLSTLTGMMLPLITILAEFALKRLNDVNISKKHISEVKFDKEFEIYQELCEKNLTAVYDVGVSVLIVRGAYNNDKKYIKEFFEKFCIHHDDADFSNKKFAAFIDKSLFDQYQKLQDNISDAFKLFSFWVNYDSGTYNLKGNSYKKEDINETLTERQKEISKLSDKITDDVRKYLKSLDVIK